MNTEPQPDTEPTLAQPFTQAPARAPYEPPTLEMHGTWSLNIGLTTSGSEEPPIIPW